MRGRNRKGGGSNQLNRSYESNGPDVKIRGTASHIADKYVQLSRDALSSGDPVAAENYMQHAEHYYRILAAAQQAANPNAVIVRADDEREEYETDEADDVAGDNGHANGFDADGEQPVIEDEQPREFRGPRSQREPREQRQPRESRPPRDSRPPRVEVPAVDDEQPSLPAFITGGSVAAETSSDEPQAEEDAAPRRGRRRRSRYGRATGDAFDAGGDDAAASGAESVPAAE